MATLDKKMLEDQRRQLRTRVAYIFCLHFLLTPYCAYFLHQFTSLFMQLSSGTYRGKISLELDWNYLKALFLLIIKRERYGCLVDHFRNSVLLPDVQYTDAAAVYPAYYTRISGYRLYKYTSTSRKWTVWKRMVCYKER